MTAVAPARALITEALRQLELPESMLASRLMQSGGVLAVRGLIPGDLMEALAHDFRAHLPKANRVTHSGTNSADWRGGEPARALYGVAGGDLLWSLFGSPGFRSAITQLTGLNLVATGAGSYSRYSEPGDFLALHRDIVRCDVAVITCVEDEGPSQSRLRAYPEDATVPLSDIYRRDRRGGVDVRLAVGDTAVIAGGVVPHEVTPVAAGQRRAVAITCFHLASVTDSRSQ